MSCLPHRHRECSPSEGPGVPETSLTLQDEGSVSRSSGPPRPSPGSPSPPAKTTHCGKGLLGPGPAPGLDPCPSRGHDLGLCPSPCPCLAPAPGLCPGSSRGCGPGCGFGAGRPTSGCHHALRSPSQSSGEDHRQPPGPPLLLHLAPVPGADRWRTQSWGDTDSEGQRGSSPPPPDPVQTQHSLCSRLLPPSPKPPKGSPR